MTPDKSCVLKPNTDVLYFRDMSDGDSDVSDLWIKNIGKRPISVSFALKEGKFFSIVDRTTGSVVPGFQAKVSIKCVHKGNNVISDVVLVDSPKGSVSIPIYSVPENARIVLDKNKINIGTTGVGSGLKFSFFMSNIGMKEGKFTLKPDCDGVTVVPGDGVIMSNQTLEVQCSITPLEVGNINFKIYVLYDSFGLDKDHFVEFHGKVLPSNLRVLFKEKEVSSFDYETMFLGQKKCYEVIIKNDSPYKRSFVIHKNLDLDNPEKTININALSIVPREGMLNPYANRKVNFIFGPPLSTKIPKQSETLVIEQFLTLEVVETSQKIDMVLRGQVVRPSISVNRVDYAFPVSTVGSKSELFMEVSNNSQLEVHFTIHPVAQFRFDPSSGIIHPHSTKKVKIIFYPKQLGDFKVSTNIVFNDGLKTIPIHLDGKSVNNTQGVQQVVTQRSSKLNHNDYLQTARYEKGERLKLVREGQNYRERENNLTPPDPQIPRGPAPLKIPNSEKFRISNKGKSNEINPGRRISYDENVLIKKKFKSKPSNPTEISDCSKPLTPAQQLLVKASHETLLFGNVSIFGTFAKSFSISNNLNKSVLIQLNMPGGEFSESGPLSQVIPPGQVAGFDIILTPTQVGTISKTVNWIVNGMHEYKFNILASVEPIDVSLSRNTIDFKFGADSIQPLIKEFVTLVNNSPVEASFEWIYQSDVFVPNEKKGLIPPKKSFTTEITYYPGTRSFDETVFKLDVKGGIERTLKLVADIGNPKLMLPKKTVDFGLIPIGINKETSITIKNIGDDDAVYSITGETGELIISPNSGRINANDEQAINLNIKAAHAHSFEHVLTINIAGSQSIKFTVTGNVELPKVKIDKKNFDFGRVFVGSYGSIDSVITNIGSIPAILILDLSQYPDFKLEYSQELSHRAENKNSISLVTNKFFVTKGNFLDSDISFSEEDTANNPISNVKSGEDPVSGLTYRILVQPDTEVAFRFVFQPRSVCEYGFELPLSLINVGSAPMFHLQPIVSCEAVLSPINVSSGEIAFGICPISSKRNTSYKSSKKEILFTNTKDKDVKWHIILNEPFKSDMMEGTISSSMSQQVNISFEPKQSLPYSTYLQLYAENDRGEFILVSKTHLTGVGTSQMFHISPSSICLPIVHLNQQTTGEVILYNDGLIQGSVKAEVSVDENTFPVKISFPHGDQLSRNTAQLPISITFCSNIPTSFSAAVAIISDTGHSASFSVICTADNSIFTLLTKDNDILSQFLSHEDYSDIKPDEFKPTLSSISIDFFIRYLNSFVLSTPLSSFPDDLINRKASPIFEMIHLESPRKEDVMSFSWLQLAKRLITQLRSNGCLLANVCPEYLLPKTEFINEMRDKVTRNLLGMNSFSSPKMSDLDQGMLSELLSSSIFSNALMKQVGVIESVYHTISHEAWSVVLMQVIKIFIFGRIDDSKFLQIQGVNQTFKDLKACGDLYSEFSKNFRSIYTNNSAQESCLLKWVSLYRTVDSRKLTIYKSFSELADGVGLSSVAKRIHGEIKFSAQMKGTEDMHSKEDNCTTLTEILKQMKLSFLPRPDEMTQGNPIVVALATLYLYETLPHYSPSSVIEFPAILHKQCSKSVTIANPSKTVIKYVAQLSGSPDFSLPVNTVTIEANSSCDFYVRFSARNILKASGKLTLIPQRSKSNESNPSNVPQFSAPIVMKLEATVTVGGADATQEVETTLYQPMSVTFTVPNIFQSPASLCFKSEMIEDGSGNPTFTDKFLQKFISNPEGERDVLRDPYDETKNSIIDTHLVFVTNQTILDFSNGKKESFCIDFIPIFLGKYRCLILAKSGNDMFIAEIIGKVKPPPFIEVNSNKFRAEAGQKSQLQVPIDFINHSLTKALAYGRERWNTDSSDKHFYNNIARVTKDIELVFKRRSIKFTVQASQNVYFGVDREVVLDPNVNSPFISVLFKPSKPGEYPCTIVATDNADIRFLKFKGISKPRTREVSLSFSTSMGKPIKQEIPINNHTSETWNFKVSIEGSKAFTCPNKITVKGESTQPLEVQFTPTQMGKVSATMTVFNTSNEQTTIYNLQAVVEEPPAEKKIKISCQARKEHTEIIKVPPFGSGSAHVESTVPLLDFNTTITFEAGKHAEFPFKVYANRTGVTAGTLTFVDIATKQHIWYVIEIQILPPEPERVFSIQTTARNTVTINIPITNNNDKASKFEVHFTDSDLYGYKEIIIPGKTTYNYILQVIPRIPVKKAASIFFSSEFDGEFWYSIKIEADTPPAQTLAPLASVIGKPISTFVLIDNPLDVPVNIRPDTLSSSSFEVLAKKVITLQPKESRKIEIRFTPASVGKKETAIIYFRSSDIGDFTYHVSGVGKPPQTMSPTIVTTAVGTAASALVIFTHPFLFPCKYSVSMNDDKDGIFSFLTKKKKATLTSVGEELQISLAFKPKETGQFQTMVIVAMHDSDGNISAKWCYPVVGNCIATSANDVKEIRTKANISVENVLSFILVGQTEPCQVSDYKVLTDLDESYEFLSSFIEIIPKEAIDQEGAVDLRCNIRFSPRRPATTTARILIKNLIGQEWVFPVSFYAEIGNPVSCITCECGIGKTTTVNIPYPASFSSVTPFHAYLATGTTQEFSLTPEFGQFEILDEGELSNITVSFAPKMYGRPQKGMLVIDTLDTQYIYEIIGKTPEYVPPHIEKGVVKQKKGLLGQIKKSLSISKPNVTSHSHII